MNDNSNNNHNDNNNSYSSSHPTTTLSNDNNNTLLVVIVDVSPYAWGDRDVKRCARDQQRTLQNKRSIGPAILEEVIQSLCAFFIAVSSMERNAGIIVLGVADNESAILFPRNDALTEWTQSSQGSYTPTLRTLQEDILTGVTELMHRALQKVQKSSDSNSSIPMTEGAMASAFSKALCVINRLFVAAQSGYGVSALVTSQYMERNDHSDDGGVIALMSKGDKSKQPSKVSSSLQKQTRSSVWSPRILILQASHDRSRDYNAFMNCAFAAAKHSIVVDGCYLSSELSSTSSSSSSFLEQTCDLTGGVYLAPSGAAQVGGALTAVLFAVFLAPISCRPELNLPSLHKVDFRARCFETGETVDMAYVCNHCLSIFKDRPQTWECSTCHAAIIGNEKYRPVNNSTR
jgi:transcription initiation factor TFIIH subunit 3